MDSDSKTHSQQEVKSSRAFWNAVFYLLSQSALVPGVHLKKLSYSGGVLTRASAQVLPEYTCTQHCVIIQWLYDTIPG